MPVVFLPRCECNPRGAALLTFRKEEDLITDLHDSSGGYRIGKEADLNSDLDVISKGSTVNRSRLNRH